MASVLLQTDLEAYKQGGKVNIRLAAGEPDVVKVAAQYAVVSIAGQVRNLSAPSVETPQDSTRQERNPDDAATREAEREATNRRIFDTVAVAELLFEQSNAPTAINLRGQAALYNMLTMFAGATVDHLNYPESGVNPDASSYDRARQGLVAGVMAKKLLKVMPQNPSV